MLLIEQMVESERAYKKAYGSVGVESVEVAHTLSEAQRKLFGRHEPYDLIVVDGSFWSDKPSAIELCKKIRSNDDFEHTALLMISNNTDALTIEEAFRAGVDEFLPKYVSLQDLQSLSLRAIVDRRLVTRGL
ncbi:MAG TPA: response regulator [Bdellovibrionota bacterium]|nr:response regulator [Bdellovibrionota bacterium]